MYLQFTWENKGAKAQKEALENARETTKKMSQVQEALLSSDRLLLAGDVCLCMYAFVYIHNYMYLCICMYDVDYFIYVYMYICIYAYVYMHVYICMCISAYVCMMLITLTN